MAARSDLLVRIDATLLPLQRKLDDATKRLKRFGFRAERTGSELTQKLTLPIIAAGAAAVASFAKFDKYEKGLSAIAGSADEGSRQLSELLDLVKDTRTTLDLSTASNAALQLQSVGQSSKEAQRLIQQLGLAATVSGKSVDDVGGAVRQFTQVLAKGSIEQEDFLTITERLPILGDLIRNELGFSTAEEIRNSGISMQEFVGRLTEAAEQSDVLGAAQGGLSGGFTSLSIGAQQAAFTFGKAISNALNLEKRLGQLADFLSRAAEGFANLNPGLQKFIIFSATAVAAAGPLIFSMGAAARLLPTLVSGFSILSGPLVAVSRAALTFGANLALSLRLFASGGAVAKAVAIGGALGKVFTGLKIAGAALISPIGLIAIGIAALVAGFITAYKNSEFFRRQVDNLWASLKDLFAPIADLFQSAFPALKRAVSGVSSALRSILPVLAGITSALVELITLVVEDATNVFGGIGDLLSGNFRDAAKKISRVNILNFQQAGGRLANAFMTTFSETVDSLDEVTQDAVDDVDGSGSTSPAQRAGRQQSGGATTPLQAVQSVTGREITATITGVDLLQRSLENLNNVVVNPLLPFADRDRQVMDELAVSANEGLAVAFDAINQRTQVFGQTIGTFNEKLSATRDAINFLLEEGFSPLSEEVLSLKEKYDNLQISQDEFNNRLEGAALRAQLFENASNKAFDSVAQAMAQGESAVKAFGKAVVSSIRDALAATIKLAVAQQVEKALVSVPFPFNVGLAAAAGAAASALFSSVLGAVNIPALAEGGVVDRPTLALIGEAGPEAVVPLNQYNRMAGAAANSVQVGGTFRIRGEDLVVLIDRARSSQNRGG